MQSLFVLSTQQSILRVKNGLLLDVNFVHSALLDIHVCRIHNIFSKRVKKRANLCQKGTTELYQLMRKKIQSWSMMLVLAFIR